MFDLELPGLTALSGVLVEQAVADAGAWPVRFSPSREERRWFGIRKAYPAVLEILTADGQGHILCNPDRWDEHRWQLRPDAAPRLARLIELLAHYTERDFTFRATWAGSPIEQTVRLPVTELAALVRANRLNDHTRYVVCPQSSRPEPEHD
ncbi:MAG: hypothetical protein QM679_00555 [Patulibacter sp.]